MVIVYPVEQRLHSSKAHDVLIVRTCHILATLGHLVFMVIQDVGVDQDAFLAHYGIKNNSNLKVVAIPVRTQIGGLTISWRVLYRWLCYSKIRRLLRSNQVDFIYVSEPKLACHLLRFCSFLMRPIVYEFHNLKALEEYPLRANYVDGNIIKSSSAIIVTTTSLLNVVETLYGRRERVAIVPLAADLHPFAFNPVREGIAPRIFYMGRHYPLQGVELLVDAMVHLPGCVLHTVGGQPWELERIRKIAQRNDVMARVHCHGSVPPANVAALAEKADVLVVPSRSTGRMSYVAHTKVYEYMAFGKPIVATDLPSIREVLIHRRNAILVAPDDARSLVDGIREVLANAALATEISRNAYESAKKYTWHNRGKGLEACFEGWLSG